MPLCGFQHVQLCLCLSLFNKRGREEGGASVGAAAFSLLHLFLPDPFNCGLRVPVEWKEGGGETRREVAEVTEEFYNR